MIAKQDKKQPLTPLSLSFLIPKTNIKYFNCTTDNQLLNYVCLNKNCEKKGLICSMCKSEHNKHEIIPLKILLNQLQKYSTKNPQCDDGFQQQLVKLQNIYKTMLFHLKNCVEQLSEKFRQIQILIHEEFNQAKISLLERVILVLSQVQINMKLPTFIEQTINNKYQSKQAFMRDIEVLIGMVEMKQNPTQPKQERLQFSSNYDEIIKNFQKIQNALCQNLNQIEKFVISNKFIKLEQIPQSSSIQPPSQFQQLYKSKTITLLQNNKIATQTKSGLGRFAFVTNCIGSKQTKKLKFKIKVLKNWIGLGIGIRQRINNLYYKFQFEKVGHGCYLISSNGFSWSHTEIHNNIKNVQFTFIQGDIIQVQYQKNKLVFTNLKSNKKCQLTTSLTQDILKDVFFCVNLCSEGDSVEIIQ